MGNVRLSYFDNGSSAEVLDVNDYYPFGMNFLRDEESVFGVGSGFNYKYNSKELQETGMYDYGWRKYMPDIGRWFGMDQLSESYHSYSPYNYVMNNPVMFLDPDGRCVAGTPYCVTGYEGNGPIDIEEVVIRPKPKVDAIAESPLMTGGYISPFWGIPSGVGFSSGTGGSSAVAGGSGGNIGANNVTDIDDSRYKQRWNNLKRKYLNATTSNAFKITLFDNLLAIHTTESNTFVGETPKMFNVNTKTTTDVKGIIESSTELSFNPVLSPLSFTSNISGSGITNSALGSFGSVKLGISVHNAHNIYDSNIAVDWAFGNNSSTPLSTFGIKPLSGAAGLTYLMSKFQCHQFHLCTNQLAFCRPLFISGNQKLRNSK